MSTSTGDIDIRRGRDDAPLPLAVEQSRAMAQAELGAQRDDAPPSMAVEQRYRLADRLLGKRWIGLIVSALLHRPYRFSELGACIGLVSDRTLSARLGELEACGIVERRVNSEAKPVRIEYALTPKGYALEPLVREIARWADEWLNEGGGRRAEGES